ncbi:hypothetical protein Esti_004945 [Eimeria stiedai]
MEQQQEEPPSGAPSYAQPSSETARDDNRLTASSANGSSTRDDDPPRKRRLLFPKARPKKIQEFLGRGSSAGTESSQASQLTASKPADARAQHPPPPPDDIEAVVCGGRSFEEVLAAAGVVCGDSQPPDSAEPVVKQRPPMRPHRLKCATTTDQAALDHTTSSAKISCSSPKAETALAASNEEATSSRESLLASAAPPFLSASTSLLDSSCLGVQRLTLHSPSSNQVGNSTKPTTFLSGKSPLEKRPSSGLGELGGGDYTNDTSDLGDGGLGPLQKAVDFSGISLAVRLQSKVVKQRVHGCDEVVMRLTGCNNSEERVQLWNELVKHHLSGILKDTNVLVGSKAVEMLVALVKGNDQADAAAFPAAAALPLLQQNGKLIVTQLLSNPRHFPSCCEVMLTLSQASSECATETVSLLAAVNQHLLEERKGNVAAIKGQGMRVVGSSMELLSQMLQSFGIQLVLGLGGVKGLIQPVASFASCSDKRVRTALSTLAATSIYLTKATAGEVAGASAKKTVLECMKGSKSMQTEVEQLLEKFAAEPPPTSTRRIAGIGSPPSGADEAREGGIAAGDKGPGVSALLLSETDVLKTVCQQQTDWVVRVTEGRHPVTSGEREGAEEAPWKVKLQAWQQLESALRDCVCLYKKNPFLQQQLLPLMHRVLTVEPTLPVVTCVLKTLQVLTQLLLQPRGGEGSQQVQQQLRVLLPDVLAKLKVNNRPVQVAACACLGTYLCCLPIDVVVGDLLPMKEKLANYQKLLLDELTKAIRQQRGTPALHRAAGLLFAAAKVAAEDGNAAVRAAGVSLLAALATHAEGSAAVGDAMQKLPEQRKQQLQKALASSNAAAATVGAPSPVLSPRHATVPTGGAQAVGVPFSRMRNRGAAVSGSSAVIRTTAAERPGGNVSSTGPMKGIRRQGSAAIGSASTKSGVQRNAGSTTAVGSAALATAPPSCGGIWEVPPVTVSAEEAKKRAQELLPPELLQGLDAAVGIERKKAYAAFEAWCCRPCECMLCNRTPQEEHMEADGDKKNCKLETFRRSAVHILLHLRAKLKGFKERTAALEESCVSCLKSILGGLLLPLEAFDAVVAATKNPGGSPPSSASRSNKDRNLPPVDKSIVSLVLEPLGDRLGDPRVGTDVLIIGGILARCIETPTTVAAQLALLAEGRAAGGRMVQGVCSLLEQLLQQWELQAFTPPKQLLMIVRQMLEPNKGPRSLAFPILKRLHGEIGDKAFTAMLVAHPLPDDVKDALKRQPPQQQLLQQQQQRQPHQSAQHQASDGSETPWSSAAAALRAGASVAAAALNGVASSDSSRQSKPCEVSTGKYITTELLQRMQQSNDEEQILKALHELMNIFVNKAGDRVKPEGLSGIVTLLRKRIGDSSAAVRRQALVLLIIFCERLGSDGATGVNGADAPPSAARVYKQMLPAAAECLCDPDKRVLQVAHLATAKWFIALGVDDSLPLLQAFLSSSSAPGGTVTHLGSHKMALGSAILRRAFSIGPLGAAVSHKNTKVRDALLNILALTMPMKPQAGNASVPPLIQSILDMLLPQPRADAAAGFSPASVLLSLLTYQGGQRGVIEEVLQQRQTGQGSPTGAHSTKSVLNSLLVPEETIRLLMEERRGLRALFRLSLSSSPQNGELSETSQQRDQEPCKDERIRMPPASAPISPTEASRAPSTTFLSTRSQRIQRSSGAGFVTARRHQSCIRDDLYNELKGRLDPSLLLLMFPVCGSLATAGGRQASMPQLAQLKGAYEMWTKMLHVDCSSTEAKQEHGNPSFPLHGEQSITDLLLKWIAFCISEVQQQRTLQAHECLFVLLQMLQLLLQPYSVMRLTLPLYEQQQILQQLLDTATANVATASGTASITSKPMNKHLRQIVRDDLLLLAAIAEDRTRFLSAIHRSLIRCKNKELLVDLMAAMTRALGQHVHVHLHSKGGAVGVNDALSDFLSQQCAARFFSFLTDVKAPSEQRALAFDFLVFCNLAVKGGALHLLPSLSPECRARLVEATKQIIAAGLPRSRLESLISRHCEPCSTIGEESTEPPKLEAQPSCETASVHEGMTDKTTSCFVLPCAEASVVEALFVDSPTSALASAVAQADALLQLGGEELQQQASALEGWLAAAKGLHTQSEISEAAFTSCLDSTVQQDRTLSLLTEPNYNTTSGATGPSVEQLCCLTALKTWCAELQLQSLPRAAYGAHSLLFLLTSAPPNPSSATATAAAAAAASSARALISETQVSQAEGRPPTHPSEPQATRRSGRQPIQLTSVGETVLNAHPLCLHFVLDGITKSLTFFFEVRNYKTLHSAGLSLQGAASALLLADAVTRRRMQQYKIPSDFSTLKQKGASVLPTQAASGIVKDGILQPLPDKLLLQRCCSCLLLCMGRYQEYLYKSPMDSRFGPVRYLVTFLLNQVLGRNILQGDLRVLSCIAECCFTEAAQAIGSAYQETRRRPNETLWRLVAKVHKKSVPLLEKYAATAQQPMQDVPHEGFAGGSQELHVQALSVLELVNTIVTSLSLVDGAYNTARLLLEQRRQQHENARKTLATEEKAPTVTEDQQALLASLRKDRTMFLLHAKLFMHSFLSICPILLGIHLKATGIAESAERSRWLERLLRGLDNDESDEFGTPADGSFQATNVRGAEEACKALRAFSCSAVVDRITFQNTQVLLMCHRNSLEGALKRTEDDAMQVDSPPSRDEGASKVVKTVLKGRETALRSLLLHAGTDQNKGQSAGITGSQIFNWPSLAGASIKEHPHDSSDDFTLHPLLQKIRQSLLSPSQQHTLLQSQSSGLERGSGGETAEDRTAVHLLRFCGGTAALLPHHKLATLRAEAALADRVPTDWLDLTSVAHSYKLDAQSSQPSCKATVSHVGAQGAPQAEFVAGSLSRASGRGEINQFHQRAEAPVSSGQTCKIESAHDVKASGGCPALGSNNTHFSSIDEHPGDNGAAAIVTEKPALSVSLRHGHQATLQGSSARSTSMRNLRGSSDDKHDLSSTPVPASKLPQCGTARLVGPVSSPAGSRERSSHGGSASGLTHSLLRRSSRPYSSRGSLLTDAQ